MKTWIYTNEDKWVAKWNELVLLDSNSSFLQLTYRINSYRKYGFDWELLICIDENENILLGSANIIVNLFFCKLYICSFGPSINNSNPTTELDSFILHFVNRAVELKACASQITLLNFNSFNNTYGFKEGRFFKNIPVYQHLNIIKLQDDKHRVLSKEELISSFSYNGRRDVRASYRKSLISKLAITNDELRFAYSCIEMNAKNKGYYVRSWKDIGDMIITGVNNKMAYVITAWYDNEIQGAILLERSHNILHYTMGGVHRHTPDLLTGYFLQMEAILLASNLNLQFYNISHGGPKEVQRFKGMFNPSFYENGKTIYLINKKIRYKIFIMIYNGFVKNIIPKILSIKKKLIA